MVRKSLIPVAAAALVLFATPPNQAEAQFANLCVTVDGPCSSIADQLLQYARQALQLEQEVITAVQEVTNTIALPFQIYHDISAQINTIVGLAKQADLLIGNTGGFIQNLNAGYYPLPVNGMQQLVAEQNAIANAISQLGQVIGVVNPQLTDRAAVIAAIQAESLGDVGRLQALQHAQQLAATTAQDMHSLLNLTLSMAQGQHAALLAEHDRKAMSDAWSDQLATAYTPLDLNAPGY